MKENVYKNWKRNYRGKLEEKQIFISSDCLSDKGNGNLISIKRIHVSANGEII